MHWAPPDQLPAVPDFFTACNCTRLDIRHSNLWHDSIRDRSRHALFLEILNKKTSNMTQLRKGSFIKKVKDISMGGALALALLSGTTLSSCSSNNDESDYSYEETTYGKGIRSQIKEVSPGEFKIMSEESVPADSSVAIVTYLDGHKDSLNPASAKALIDQEIRSNPNMGYHSGLSSMLLYGGMGYLLGRGMGNSYINTYRDRQDEGQRRSVYAGTGAYAASRTAFRDVDASRSVRTVNARPAGGRKGFFGRSSSGRSGG